MLCGEVSLCQLGNRGGRERERTCSRKNLQTEWLTSRRGVDGEGKWGVRGGYDAYAVIQLRPPGNFLPGREETKEDAGEGSQEETWKRQKSSKYYSHRENPGHKSAFFRQPKIIY